MTRSGHQPRKAAPRRRGRCAAAAGLSLVLVAGCGGRTAYTHSSDDGPVTAPAAELAAGNWLGPDGFGKVKLGMTTAQALATAQIGMDRGGLPACHTATETGAVPGRGGGVWISTALGVAKIGSFRGVRTPQGIGLRASLDEVRHAYPDVRVETERDMGDGAIDMDDHYRASVPGNPNAGYRFFFDRDDKVDAMLLVLLHQDCDVGYSN